MLASKVLQFTDDPAHAADNHMLGYRYHTGARVVHLNQEPRVLPHHIPSGFYRRDLIGGLRFDRRLRASFEDAAFEASSRRPGRPVRRVPP